MSASELGGSVIVESVGPVDWVTLSRPRSLNAITQEMTESLNNYFQRISTDYSVRIVVLRGAGRAFCAGLDLKEGPPRVPPQNQAKGPHASLSNVVKLMRSCPQPIISLVHGAACGGGFTFALASDVRIAGESARMNDAFIRLGLSGCELGMSFFLPRIVGLSSAVELMYTGDFVDAQNALRIGLVSRVVPDDGLADAARDIISAMLKASPQGLRSTKRTLNQALKLNDLEAIIDLEERAQIACMHSEEFRNAIAAGQMKSATPPRDH